MCCGLLGLPVERCDAVICPLNAVTLWVPVERSLGENDGGCFSSFPLLNGANGAARSKSRAETDAVSALEPVGHGYVGSAF